MSMEELAKLVPKLNFSGKTLAWKRQKFSLCEKL
jgi:hypothetical protein